MEAPSDQIDEDQVDVEVVELVASVYEELGDAQPSCVLPAPLVVAAVAASSSWFDTHEKLHTLANCGKSHTTLSINKNNIKKVEHDVTNRVHQETPCRN